jgi:hypothetical protein
MHEMYNSTSYFAKTVSYERNILMKLTARACTKKLFTALYGLP